MKHPIFTWRAIGLSALVGFAGCSRETTSDEGPPIPKVEGARITFPSNAPQLAFLTIQTAEPRRLAITHLTGRLYWSDDTTVRIFTPVMGRIAAVKAEVGQAVFAGAPLAEISSPDYGQALADARTATANFAAADKANARTKDLFDHGAAAQKDVEAAETAYQGALAERDRATSRLNLYGGQTTDSGETFVLRSPVAGVVVERTANPGQEVRSDQMLANAPNLYAPLFVVGNPDVLWLQLDVAESDLPSLEKGQQLRIYSKAFPDKLFTGIVQTIADEMDPATRTVKVCGVVSNPDKHLKAEMYVTVDVVRDESQVARAGVEVSAKAIFMIESRNYLFVALAPGQYERREIQVGTEKDGVVPIFAGVNAGEKVVAEGGLLLQSVLEPAD